MSKRKSSVRRLPKSGTIARDVMDDLVACSRHGKGLSFSTICRLYVAHARRITGIAPNIHYVGLTVQRILKKYCRKLGKAGGRGLWVYDPVPLEREVPRCELLVMSKDLDPLKDDDITQTRLQLFRSQVKSRNERWIVELTERFTPLERRVLIQNFTLFLDELELLEHDPERC